jgi:predicted lipoprotein with Yx(FWY)xxD motif
LALLGPAVAGLTLASACQSATNELNPGREHLSLASRPSLGQVLTDDQGRTLYLFGGDQRGESYCNGACASVWPPLTTKGIPTVSAGVDSSKVTLLKRDDGLMQVAYNGHPLYYYQGDTSSDDIYGQALNQFGAEWYALTPAGSSAESRNSGSSGSSGSNGGTGGTGGGGSGGSGSGGGYG